MKTFRLLFLLFFGIGSTRALELPSEFKIQPSAGGFDLVWSSANVKVSIGAARPEFRFADGTVFGYPREVQGELHLPLTSALQATLDTLGPTLQAWLGRKRIDGQAPMNIFQRPALDAADPVVVNTPIVNINPARMGNFTTRRNSYNLDEIAIDKYPLPIEVIAEVTDPPQATGKRPLVLFLHGRHAFCYQGLGTGEEWPCADDYLPIPSHQGYRYVADILASQGYVVVSISANGISAQDFESEDLGSSARSTLIRYHLSLWAQWNTNGGSPWGNRFKGRLDMNRVVLVGHSRGGEGVHRAAIDAVPSDPYKIVGLVTYGPTAYNKQVTPDVHSVNILPTCDGDVADLQGQAYVDTSRDIAYSEALRSAVISVGTNHNYFNTEWTPGFAVAPAEDDWELIGDKTDPVCGSDGGSVRLTPLEQQVVGATYTLALVKLAVNQDLTVLPLLDGSYVRPKVIGRADVATNAVGGAKNRILYRVEDASTPTFRNGMTGRECLGSASSSTVGSCGTEDEFLNSPHWLPSNSRPSTFALELQWSDRPGAIARFPVRRALRNLTALDSLDVRIANDPDNSGVRFKLVVSDQLGRNATLSTNITTIEGWLGENYFLNRVHARTLRGSLASVRSKVDLSRINAVFLVAESATGRVWVLDIAASQARIQVPAVLNLPQLSVEDAEVFETDGFQQYNLSIITDRPLTTNATIWVETRANGFTGYLLNLVPGSSTSNVVAQIPFEYVGDNIYSNFLYTEYLSIEAVNGVVTGDFFGALTITEDEPVPNLSANARNVTATEGTSLRWTLRLSSPTAGTTLYFTAVKPNQGQELTSRDVASSWLQSVGVYSIPSTPVPLSELGLSIEVRFGYGIRVVDLLIPLAADGVSEGIEVVTIQQQDDYFGAGTLLTLTGNVAES